MRGFFVVLSNRGIRALVALMFGLHAANLVAQERLSNQPDLLTNLFQFRRIADRKPTIIHPFRIIAEVCDADSASGTLALRDESGIEFIQLDLRGQKVEPGATVCLEGTGFAVARRNFGLDLVPARVIDNDGFHPVNLESGTVFLRAGLNPITLQWFNGSGAFGLNVGYAGPNLRRQSIPSSVLSRAELDPQAGNTRSYAGLDFRCYEGDWQFLPDFTKLQPVRTGVTTNFDLSVRTRDQFVGLEFNGFIRIPQDGAYTFYLGSDDGSRLFVGDSSVSVREWGQPRAPDVQKASATAETNNRRWLTLEGTASFSASWENGGELQMQVGRDDVRVEVLANGGSMPNLPWRTRVRVSGAYEDITTGDDSRGSGRLMVCSWNAVRPLPSPEVNLTKFADNDSATYGSATASAAATNTRPVITTIEEIKALPAEIASKGLPVSIRGVVVVAGGPGAVVQDSTKGIFVLPRQIRNSEPLTRGQIYQIDGVTDPGFFAPQIAIRKITHLGAGVLPKPVRATWEQLMNGSLDTQYVELEGVVTAIRDQQFSMLTEGGKLTLNLNHVRPEPLAGCENAVVLVRGCVFGPFNVLTHKVEPGMINMEGATVSIVEPAPRNVFDAPQKAIAELLYYDPKAAPFRMLKVSGQVIYGRAGEYFLTDGTNGMHVTSKSGSDFAVGDLVDAVGFLAIGGPAVELREAAMRKTGKAPLPPPTKLTPDRLLQASYAGTLVQVKATLMNQWREGPDQFLELQSGFFAFRVRIDSHGRRISLPPSGSLLELTGVYSSRGQEPGDGKVNSFDLLLSSPAGMRILKTPSWWTLKRVVVLLGVLAVLLCVVLFWNKELQRKVQQRERQLEIEVGNRQLAELQHAAEAERSRIARDLHDELGAGLTAVSLLASAGLGEFRGMEKVKGRLHAIAEKARNLVAALDIIVWAIDPGRNSLQSFADYLRSYAKELLSASSVACHFRIPIERETATLPGSVRHSLLLAIKEALNNVIRHASATEVELQMKQSDDHLEICIADNGGGFDLNIVQRGHGLTNLKQRMEALHGQCRIESQPGQGTTIRLIVPLFRNPS